MKEQEIPLHKYKSEIQRVEISVRAVEDIPLRKDKWDKFGSLSGVLSGILVAIIGFYATTVYDARKAREESAREKQHLAILQVQTLGGFIPYLASDDEKQKKAAIISIAALGNPELATEVALVFGGTGSSSALTQLAATSTPEVARSAEEALSQLFARFRAGVVRIEIENQLFTGFFVSHDGLVVTAGHAAQILQTGNYDLRLLDGTKVKAQLVHVDRARDVALLRAEISRSVSLPLSDERVEAGARVIGLGQTPEKAWLASVGTVTNVGVSGQTIQFGEGRTVITTNQIETSLRSYGGFSGAPVINPAGEVIGMVQAGREDEPLSLLVPAADISATLNDARVDRS